MQILHANIDLFNNQLVVSQNTLKSDHASSKYYERAKKIMWTKIVLVMKNGMH